MSIFQKGPPRVEIFIHHHSFGVRPPNLAEVTFMIYKPKKYIIQIRALSSGANNRWIFIKDGAKYGERLFRKTRMGILGIFLIFSAIGLGGFRMMVRNGRCCFMDVWYL